MNKIFFFEKNQKSKSIFKSSDREAALFKVCRKHDLNYACVYARNELIELLMDEEVKVGCP